MSEAKSDTNGGIAPALSSEKQPLLSSFRKSDSVISNRSVTFGEEVASPSKRAPLRSASSFMRHFTDSERLEALEKPGVGAAAFLIRDAVLGDTENPAEGAYDPYKNPDHFLQNLISVWCRRLCSMRSICRFMNGVVWALALLSFFEPPPWCFHIPSLLEDDDDDNFDTIMTVGHCHIVMSMRGPPATEDNTTSTEEVEYYPASGALLLARYQAEYVEFFCLAMITIFLMMKIGRDGCSLKRFLRPGPAQMSRASAFFSAVALVVGMVTSTVLPGYHPRYDNAMLAS